MNELFNGLEYVKAYIDDLLIISNGNIEDHLNKVKKKSFKQIKSSWFPKQCRKIVFRQR